MKWNDYHIACGSVPGTMHRRMFYNNQDAFSIMGDERCLAAVVSDGCGSSPHAEVGSRLTAEYVTRFCMKYFRDRPFDGELLRNGIEEYYRALVRDSLTESVHDFVYEKLLCTVIGCFVSDDTVWTFTSGDGAVLVNDNLTLIRQNNRPSFLGYLLTHGAADPFTVEAWPRAAVQRLLLSTDGIDELWPEGDDPHSFMQNFLNETELFTDERSLPRQLFTHPALVDDTTLVILARMEE